MNVINALQHGFGAFFTDPVLIILLIAGVFIGMVFGSIPGLTATLAVTLFLPFTFALKAGQGLTALIAIYVGGISGGLISACLLNIPGTPSSMVTCFDGAPMARNGRPADALSIGVFASLVGGLFSAVALCCIAPALAKVALMFGPWEYFAMGMMGLMVVISVCSKDLIKGLMGAVIGLLLSTVGMDPISSIQRFTFGKWELGGGLNATAAMMGLFALSEILVQLRDLKKEFSIIDTGKIGLFPRKETISGIERLKVFILSSVIGTVVGILPGIGQSTATMMSYNTARQISKTPEKFGTGHEEGVIASECSNNAVCGGALIPMMTLGIPGDTVTAILLGGLIVHGLQPGPLLFTNNVDIVGIIFSAYIISCIVMYFMELGLMKMFIKLLSIPLNILLTVIIVMCVVGTFATNNRTFDIWVFLGVGILGYFLVSSGFSLPPVVLGYILGPIIEKNYRVAIISSKGHVLGFLESPIAIVLLLLGVVLLVLPFIMGVMKKKKSGKINL
ncbi:MAG: tripartite tricarboxylate transporter permease [Lachnospiraceae bacterium]|nr:tripartite tricarboxylate transporter permease [Lachnospiraceae bacterium]